MTHPYEQGLERNQANYTPLTPVSFLAKAAYTYPLRTAMIHGAVRRNWRMMPTTILRSGIGRKVRNRSNRKNRKDGILR